MINKIVKWLWIAFATVILVIFLGIIGIETGIIGYMPDFDELQSPISRYASQILSADGKLMGTWSRNENRVFVGYDSISSHVIDALIATEDSRFMEHSGIDARAVGRAVVKRGMFRQKEAGGGSTITQQLAKQLYSQTAHSTMERLMQKPIEWIIAVELERRYTKEEIITLYLNYFDFLHNAVGIKTAANVYFNKHPKDLTLTEAATLVGMCKNPAYFNPVRFPERSTERRNVVLQQMVKAGVLTDSEFETEKSKPLALNFHRLDHKDGIAPYLREYLRRIMMAEKPKRDNYATWQDQEFYQDSLAWENDPLYGWCNKNRKRNGDNYDIYTDGLKVYTTIDSRMQRYAEDAVRKQLQTVLQPAFMAQKKSQPAFPYTGSLSKEQQQGIIQRAIRQSDRYRLMKSEGATDAEINEAFRQKVPMTVFSYNGDIDTTMTPLDSILYYKSFIRAAMLSIEPQTGYVKAYVGGPDFKYFQYDMAMVGRRQVGSTCKPFVYAMAMEDGYTPNDVIQNVQRTYGNWSPRNGSHARYGENVTLKWGLSQSNNWITAEVMHRADPTGERLVKLLQNGFGVANHKLDPSIVLCLGAGEISVKEMASAYTAFVNKGIRTAPILVTKIEDSEGNIITEFSSKVNEVISEMSSYEMLEMLQAVVDHGTGGRLRYRYSLNGPIAGKTGTTNRNSDGWFVGLVPRLVTACWVGGEDRDIHFATTSMGQGAASALPIWAAYMKKVYADPRLNYSENEPFPYPEDYTTPKASAISEGGDEGEGDYGNDANSDNSSRADLFD